MFEYTESRLKKCESATESVDSGRLTESPLTSLVRVLVDLSTWNNKLKISDPLPIENISTNYSEPFSHINIKSDEANFICTYDKDSMVEMRSLPPSTPPRRSRTPRSRGPPTTRTTTRRPRTPSGWSVRGRAGFSSSGSNEVMKAY